MKTDTPETDAVAYHARQCFRPLEHVVPVDHARQLERQRDDLLTIIEPLLTAYQQFAPCSKIAQDATKTISKVKEGK